MPFSREFGELLWVEVRGDEAKFGLEDVNSL